MPTPSVITTACEKSEKCSQRMLVVTCRQLPHATGILHAIVVAIFGVLCIQNLFKDLDDHQFDCTVDQNHIHTSDKENPQVLLQGEAFPSWKENHREWIGEIFSKKIEQTSAFQPSMKIIRH